MTTPDNFPQEVAPAIPNHFQFITPGCYAVGQRAINSAQLRQLLTELDGQRWMGFNVMEAGTTEVIACKFRLWHGRDATTGRLLLSCSLSANGSRLDWFGPNGIETPYGIFVEWIAGTFDLVLYYSNELLGVYARR